MNNLLRTLTENQHKPPHDLVLLLSTVKDVRRQAVDNKAADPFYESLEGLIYDLRTVTMDNHDAEAFLKPVSKSDVPDYYDVISNPMDLQTMLKKVKAKLYKSKRDFKDDLDLMWANCLTYNATEDHPLRHCALRLKKKADRLLMNITDRKDRVDPPIPGDPQPSATTRPVTRPRINGITHSPQDRERDRTSINQQHQRSPTLSGTGSTTSTRHSANGRSVVGGWSTSTAESRSRRETPFHDWPALIRTPDGMSTFRDLDQGVAQLLDAADFQSGEPGPSTLSHAHNIVARLRQYTLPPEPDDEDAYVDGIDPDVKMETLSDTGEKRKLVSPYPRQSKRPRLTPPDSGDEVDTRQSLPSPEDLAELWWDAVQSDALFANGLPCLPSIASFPLPVSSRSARQTLPPTSIQPPTLSRRRPRTRPLSEEAQSGSLLTIMNTNIKALKRVRRTHTKFVALGFGGGDDGAGAGAVTGGGGGGGSVGPEREDVPEPESELPEEATDERPWSVRLRGACGKGKVRDGIEIGERASGSCLKWMNRKVLEHSGFQGASGAALDVLTGVASEFLLNLGRTLRFLCDKYAQTMTSEEIILHALFESGITRIQDLERYIKDDVLRQGARLLELEKKLENAYREATSADVLDDDALFNSDQEEDDVLTMGTFADALGEDVLGLRELGIAQELGLSSLSIPKRLLKGKKDVSGNVIAKPAEALLPYPPPPPFLPVTSKNAEDQIGLLHPYYHQRLASLAVTAPLPPGAPVPNMSGAPVASGVQSMPKLTIPGFPPLPPPPPLHFPSLPPVPGVLVPMPASSVLPTPHLSNAPSAAPIPGQPLLQPLVSVPEDPPNPAQTKVGPIGQVVKPSPAAASVKKKAKGKEGGGAGAATGGGAGAQVTALYSGTIPDGGIGTEGVGVGSGGVGASPKKKAKAVELPPVIAASA